MPRQRPCGVSSSRTPGASIASSEEEARIAWMRTRQIVAETPSEDLLALDEALARLEAADRTKADLVKLRYFAGLTIEQAAEVLGISPTAAKRHWTYARAWLYRAVRSAP